MLEYFLKIKVQYLSAILYTSFYLQKGPKVYFCTTNIHIEVSAFNVVNLMTHINMSVLSM